MHPYLPPLIALVGCLLAVFVGVEMASDPSITIIVAIVLGSLLLALRFPFLALGCGFLIQTVLKLPLEIYRIGFGITIVTFLLPLFPLLTRIIMLKHKPSSMGNPLILGSALFMVLAGLLYHFSPHGPEAAYYFRIHMRYPVIFFLIALELNCWKFIPLGTARLFFYVLLAAAFVNCSFAIVEFHFLPNWISFLYVHGVFLPGFEGSLSSNFQELVLSRKRAFGLMASPHSVSVCGLILLAYFVAKGTDKGKHSAFSLAAMAIAAPISLYALYVAGIRTGQFAMPLVLAGGFVLGRNRLRLLGSVGLLAAALLAGLGLVVANVPLESLHNNFALDQFTSRLSADSLYNSRLSWLWDNIQRIAENPLGYGFSYEYMNRTTGSSWGNIESSFLILASDGGIPLLLCFVAMLGSLWYLIHSVERINRLPELEWLICFSKLLFLSSIIFHMFSPLIETNEPFHLFNAMIVLPLFWILHENKREEPAAEEEPLSYGAAPAPGASPAIS